MTAEPATLERADELVPGEGAVGREEEQRTDHGPRVARADGADDHGGDHHEVREDRARRAPARLPPATARTMCRPERGRADRHHHQPDHQQPGVLRAEPEAHHVADVADEERGEAFDEPLAREHQEHVSGERGHQSCHEPGAGGPVPGVERDRHADEQREGGRLGDPLEGPAPGRDRDPVDDGRDQRQGQQRRGRRGHAREVHRVARAQNWASASSKLMRSAMAERSCMTWRGRFMPSTPTRRPARP